MDLGIANKVALVTGGVRGIGLAIVERLLAESCRVAVCDIDAEAASELPEAVFFTACDVGDEQQCQAMVAHIADQLGPIEILVNNAGVQSVVSLDDATLEDWERVLHINLTSAFVLSRLVVPGMKERGWGRIVNVASMAGKVGGLTVSASYATSKAGMIGLTKSIARAGAPEVTSNAVAPAFIRTAMTDALPEGARAELLKQIPTQSLGEPEDVAKAIVFLASDDARYVTGHVLHVDGGMAM
jgi:3-oxoacyl-[acyl-carrier protein] reductase